MAEVGAVYVSIMPTTDGFTRAVNKDIEGPLDKAAGRGEASFGRMFGKVAAIGGAVLAAIGVGKLVKDTISLGVQYNTLEQTSRAAFTTILGSADAASTMMEQIRDFGRTSPFPRQAFIEATQKMLGFGFAADSIIPTLDVIQDAVAAVGGGAEEIGTYVDIFSKIQAGGRITGEEINRFGDLGVNALQILADASGVTAEEMRKSISKGAIDSAFAIETLTAGLHAKFDGAAEGVKETWTGAVDRVKGAWRDLASVLVAPFIDPEGGGAAVDWANKFADRIRDIEAVARLLFTGDFTSSLRDRFGWEEDGAAVDGILRIREAVTGLYDLLVKGDFTGALRSAFGWEEDSPIVGFLLAVRDAFTDLAPVVQFLTPMGAAFAILGPVLTELQDPLLNLLTVFGGLAQDVLPVLSEVFGIIASVLSGVLAGALPIIVELVTALGEAFAELMPALLPLVQTLGGALLSVVAALWPVLQPILDLFIMLLDPIMAIVGAVLELLSPILELIGPLAELVFALLMPFIELLTMLLPPIMAIVSALIDNLMPSLDGLVQILSGLIEFLVGVFTGDWDRAWAGIVGIFSGIWNTIVSIVEGSVNGIIDLINMVIGGINEVGGGVGIEMGLIPRVDWSGVKLAKGGIVTAATLAMVGEGSHPKAYCR